ncbi:MAG: DUF4962 domain-containing protein, partial [Armatimonadetes bacterium]|nr:DUF4962 domain-containing protein [Armatimonadota bacterium]
MRPVLFLALLSAASAQVQPAARWDFEQEPAGWRARAESIKVERVAGQGARPESQAALRIHGQLATGWNYAISEQRRLEPGQLYRLSAWLRVDSLGETTPAPYLKCEFVAAPGGPQSRLSTTTYNARQLGTWQRLEAEFRFPEGYTGAWLALEKGTAELASIDAWLDEVVIEPIERLQRIEQYRLAPLPAPLAARRGVHPRLYLDGARVTALKEQLATTHAGLWAELRALADRFATNGPPAYRERDNYSGDEQLWQREVGNAMPYLAMAWQLTNDPKYLAGAEAWAVASCGYPTWGLGHIDGLDLAAGHQMFGLALVYDWCYDGLSAAARETIRNTLVKRCGVMFEAASSGAAWWSESYLQNHLWVNAAGLAAAGLTLFDEVEDASLWVGLALAKFERSIRALGPDGASHEGVGYWQYGAEYLLKFMALARELLAVDLYDHPWWRNTSAYALYLTLPRAAWTRSSSLVDIADCPRNNWYGPDYLLRALAAEYDDPVAQWHAAEQDAANITSHGASWLNLVWYNPALSPRPPTDLPTLRHFEDMGLVSARSDWSGEESLVVFKCGPALGHQATREFDHDPGGGHVHPDANHFVVFGHGEWLVRDDGYLPKWTAQHNTLLVDGKGQLGEGSMWLRTAEQLRARVEPRVLRAVSSPTLDQITADAASIYPRQLGLRRFVRHLLFVKPSSLLVLDDLDCDGPRSLELRTFTE